MKKNKKAPTKIIKQDKIKALRKLDKIDFTIDKLIMILVKK